MRHVGKKETGERKTALRRPDSRSSRERSHMSQAVYARHLNVTTGYVSQLELGAKRPSGGVLLNVIRRKGIDTIL